MADGTPKWFIDHRWNNPERVRERDELRDAVKDYNANLDIEDTFQSFAHRNRSSWDWS